MGRPVREIRRFFRELKRRNVYQVAATYAVVGFVLIQLADLTLVRLGLPPWTVTFVIVIVAVGFPLALVLAWAFEMSPEGVRRTADAHTGEPREAAGRGSRTAYRLLIAVGLMSAAVAGGWYLIGNGGSGGPGSEGDVTDRSIAVLPFDNLGGEDSEQLAHGVHDDLLTRLSNVSDLRVISRTSVERFEEGDHTIPEIARELGVRWILEGGVQETENLIRVNAQLIDADADDHRWAESFQRDLTAENLFAIQTDLTKRIAGSLQAELSPGEQERVERRPTQDLEAYRLYVQGRRQLSDRGAEGILRATEFFHRAIQKDSSYALAWAGLADAAVLYRFYVSGSLPDSLPDPGTTVRRALELNPELAEAHASLGLTHLFERRGPSALRALRRAVDLKPSYAQAHNWLSGLLLTLGRPGPGLEHATLAVELNPGNPAFWDELYRARIANRDYRGAVEAADGAPVGDSRATAWFAATALAHLGDWRRVRERVRRVLPDSLSMDTAPYYTLALADLESGDTASAQIRLSAMQEMTAAEPRINPHAWIALVQETLGQREAALTSLRQAVDTARDGAPYTILPQILRYYYPDLLDSLRADGRFAELMQEINVMWGLSPDGSLPDDLEVSSRSRPGLDPLEAGRVVRMRSG